MKIAVTGLNATDNPGPGIPVIRSLKYESNFNAEIIGLVYDALEPGIYMEGLVKKNYLIPFPSSGLESLFQRLYFIQQIEKIDVIIPTLDSELFGFTKLEPRLRQIGIRMFLPTIEQLNLRAKDKLFDFCKNIDINVPKNMIVTSYLDIKKIPEQFEFPVVVKGIFYDAYIVNNTNEALIAFNKISTKWGIPVIIQDFIKGDEFNVVALGDGSGITIGAVAMRKLYVTEKGKGWAGVTILDNNLLELTNRVVNSLSWRGGMELEFIKSNSTGEYFLLEINPRFPAWIYLAPNAGQNLPFAALQLALGNNVKKFKNYKVGTLFIRSSWDLITDISILEKITIQGEL